MGIDKEIDATPPVESQAHQHGQTVLNAVYAALEESMLPITELDLLTDVLTITFEDGSKRDVWLSDPSIPSGGLNPAVPPTPGDPAQQGEPAT